MPWFTSKQKQKQKQKDAEKGEEDHQAEEKDEEEEEEGKECESGFGEAKEEVLLQIRGAIAHLIDTDQSAHLATGLFSLTLLTTHHGSNQTIAVFVTIGQHLNFPLSKHSFSTKLDPTHYFFSLGVPPEIEEDNADLIKEEMIREEDTRYDSSLLHYGVTFTNQEDFPMLSLLDKYLEEYSLFSEPRIVVTPEEKMKKNVEEEETLHSRCTDDDGMDISTFTSCPKEEENEHFVTTSCPKEKKEHIIKEKVHPVAASFPKEKEHHFAETSCPKEKEKEHFDFKSRPKEKDKFVEEKSSAYWTTLAPDVEDYSSSIARGIAVQTGYVIKGMFWCSDATIQRLECLGDYAKSRIKTNDKPSRISPRTLRNLRRVKKISKTTERFAKGVLTGVITATNFVSVSAIKSKAGKKLFKMLPGEVALVSLDAFGKMFDAIELAGKNVLNSTRVVTSGVVEHKYGEQAGEAANEGLKTAGHMIETAWTVLKIRKAFNPKDSAKISKKDLAKEVPSKGKANEAPAKH